jgi:hypothetical protein
MKTIRKLIEKIGNKLRINIRKEDIENMKNSQEWKDYEDLMKLYNAFTLQYEETFLKRSFLFKNLDFILFVIQLTKDDQIFYENAIKIKTSQELYDFNDFMQNQLEIIVKKSICNVNQAIELWKLRSESKNGVFFISSINSAFADYYCLKSCIQYLKDKEPSFWLMFQNQLGILLENVNFNIKQRKSLNKETGPINNESMTVRTAGKTSQVPKFYMDEAKKLFSATPEILNELNTQVFDNSIGFEQFEIIVSIMNQMSNLDDNTMLDTQFHNIDKLFDENCKLSKRQRMLFLHDIFKLYGHPKAITDKDENYYDEHSEYASMDTLEKKKIRIIEQLLPNLK